MKTGLEIQLKKDADIIKVQKKLTVLFGVYRCTIKDSRTLHCFYNDDILLAKTILKIAGSNFNNRKRVANVSGVKEIVAE